MNNDTQIIQKRLDTIAETILKKIQAFERKGHPQVIREIFVLGEGNSDKITKVNIVAWDTTDEATITGEARTNNNENKEV